LSRLKSSLPESFAASLKTAIGEWQSPDRHVLDSTDPAQIKAFESKINIVNTFFIVSSKSGSNQGAQVCS
jgi:glucose-6-phosphate isomerase